MDTPTLTDYQKPTCPFCLADLPHARHVTALQLAQMGMRISENIASVFIGLHAIERDKTDIEDTTAAA